MRRVFNEMVQFDPNNLEGGQGSGLGMMLSKAIIEAHGGKIWLTSEGIGKGSTFAFALPIANDLKGLSLCKTRPDLMNGFLLSRQGSRQSRYGGSTTDENNHNRKSAFGTLEISQSNDRNPYLGNSLSTHSGQFNQPRRRVSSEVGFKSRHASITATSLNPPFSAISRDVSGSFELNSKQLNSNQICCDVDDSISNTSINDTKTVVNVPKVVGKTSTSLTCSPMSNTPQLTNVLIVDDSTTCRKMTANVLKSMGYRVYEAIDGTEAVTMVANSLTENVVGGGSAQSCTPPKFKYDLILCDSFMPNMNGPTAVKKIREMGYQGPIFGVTGNLLTEDASNFVKHGADAVITKPLRIGTFKRELMNYNYNLFRKSNVVKDFTGDESESQASVDIHSDEVNYVPSVFNGSSLTTPCAESHNLNNPAEFNSMHVLIVEDSATCRKMLTNVLKSLKFTSEEAEDGVEAVEMVRMAMTNADQNGSFYKITLYDHNKVLNYNIYLISVNIVDILDRYE